MSKHYVDLDLIIDRLEDEWGYEGMREELYELPRADVVEVKHGENKNWTFDQFCCSECGIELEGWDRIIREENGDEELAEFEFNFCPNCGADMRGKQDDK